MSAADQEQRCRRSYRRRIEPRRRRIRLLCGRLAAVRRDRRKRNADADRRT
jgi:hypothetical protein